MSEIRDTHFSDPGNHEHRSVSTFVNFNFVYFVIPETMDPALFRFLQLKLESTSAKSIRIYVQSYWN